MIFFKVLNDVNNDIKALRNEVFCIEQGISKEDEWDNLDKGMSHFCLYKDNELVSYLRAFAENKETAHIGRVITKKEYRNQGYGSKIMTYAEEILFKSYKTIILNAQTKAMGFYSKLGYKAFGEPFLDANIPHFAMKKEK